MPLNPRILESLSIREDDLIKWLIADTKEVFSTMVGMEDLLHLPSQVELTTHFENCVTAMVGMAGSLSGLVSIHTPQPLALQITSSMLGMDIDEMCEDVNDALGEMQHDSGSFKCTWKKVEQTFAFPLLLRFRLEYVVTPA